MPADNQDVIDLLKQAYSAELETVANYLAQSINLDGVRAEEIKKSLSADVPSELQHATELANRIKQLGGVVPGSLALKFEQPHLQTSEKTTDVEGVIKAVIEAEKQACELYQKIIRTTEGRDYVTQDLAVRLLADEEEHLVQFKGFLKEYQQS